MANNDTVSVPKKALEALLSYARHPRDCPQRHYGKDYECSCGLNDVLVALGLAKKPTRQTKTAVFWICSSRGTRNKVARQLPPRISAETAKELLEAWCETHSAWHVSENYISYGWRWEDEAPSEGEPWPDRSTAPTKEVHS